MYMIQFQRTITASPVIVGFTNDFTSFMYEYLNSHEGCFQDVIITEDQYIVRNKDLRRQVFTAVPIEEGTCKYHWILGKEMVKTIHDVIKRCEKKYWPYSALYKLFKS